MENTMIAASLPWSDGSGSSFEDQYSELASAIVMQAVKDYMKLFQRLWKKDASLKIKRKLIIEKAEIEDFFYSDWYEFLTDLDPDRLLSGCRQRVVEKEKEKIHRQNMKRVKQLRKAAEMEELHNETGQSIT